MLAIDDLQWGDVDSANLISELLRPPDPPLLLLLGCYRSEYAATSPCLRVLLTPAESEMGHIDCRELIVEPLAPPEARSLALTLLGRGDAVASFAADTVAHESRGNPYFIYELVRHVQAGVELTEHSSSAEEATLDQVLWTRVKRLPEAAYRLLEVVAVAGQPLEQADAYRAAQLAPAERTALSTCAPITLCAARVQANSMKWKRITIVSARRSSVTCPPRASRTATGVWP